MIEIKAPSNNVDKKPNYRYWLAFLALAAAFAYVTMPGRDTQRQANAEPVTVGKSKPDRAKKDEVKKVDRAIFASGCFWKPQYHFSEMPGVVATKVGYIGGKVDEPSYKQVCTDTTGHAEAVEVMYDPTKVTYKQLLAKFFSLHDPTTLNRQGPDVGTQYRSAIFYTTAEQKAEAQEALAAAQSAAGVRKVVTELVEAPTFWAAEEYHQDYVKKSGQICH